MHTDQSSPSHPSGIWKHGLSILLMSVTFIALEILWTRIFSAEFFYTFAFLILSLAILGLGLGGLSIRFFRKLNNPSLIWLYLTLSGILALVGPALVLRLDLNFTHLFSSGWMLMKFILTIVILSSSFFWGGMALTLLFKLENKKISTLYMADLIGAGLGVVIAVVLMNTIQTQRTTLLICLPVLLAALIQAPKWWRTAPAVLSLVALFLLPQAETLIHKERKERFPVIFSHWDAMANIKVAKAGDDFYYCIIDNAAHAPTFQFDGVIDKPDSLKQVSGYPLKYLIGRTDSCTFLSLGAGGGADVLNALYEGATEIHAVEVVPYLNYMMTDGFLKDFTGNMYHNKRVTVVTEDGRAYVRQFRNKFDIIYSGSTNTFAALASGSFALAENYLFTREAFEDYYRAMSDSGVMLLDHQFYIPRLVNDAIDAMKKLNVPNPASHLAVYDFPGRGRMVMLMSKQPMKKEVWENALYDLSAENYPQFRIVYPSPDSIKNNLINQIVENGWTSAQENSATDLSPSTDNRPFAAQMGMWKNFHVSELETVQPWEFKGFPLAKLLITIILLVIGLLIIPINLIPFLKKGEKLNVRGWLYFFLIGIAFMTVEVILIQKYTLFIGSSSYAFMTILFSLLLASGIGSFFSSRFTSTTPFLGIIVWIVLDVLLFGFLTEKLVLLPISGRILVTMVLILPLGFFMGMPFPKGTLRVGSLVDWGFAVNGAASVLGSTAIMLVAFNYGYGVALVTGAFAYFLAMLLMRSDRVWIKE